MIAEIAIEKTIKTVVPEVTETAPVVATTENISETIEKIEITENIETAPKAIENISDIFSIDTIDQQLHADNNDIVLDDIVGEDAIDNQLYADNDNTQLNHLNAVNLEDLDEINKYSLNYKVVLLNKYLATKKIKIRLEKTWNTELKFTCYNIFSNNQRIGLLFPSNQGIEITIVENYKEQLTKEMIKDRLFKESKLNITFHCINNASQLKNRLNAIIKARIAEQKAKELAEKLAKEEAERVQAELNVKIIAEVKSTVKLSYSITVCDNENLSVQLGKLLSQLSEKYQEKLNLPVIKEDYYGFYQDFSNFSVVELENGLCEFTAFIGEDIVQFSLNGHSSIYTAIINEINEAVTRYIKTGKIKKSSGKKPALKLTDKHNKSAKRSKEAIALAALAKNIRNTCNIKDTKYSPLERMVSDMVRVVSVDGYLQVIAVDKFDRKNEYESNTIKTFTVGQTVGSIDLAVNKVMLSEILEGIGNTGLSDVYFEQKDNNLVITHPKGEYSLILLNSDELITLFHPDDLATEITAPVVETTAIDITEGDNYILPSTQLVKLVETVVDDVIYCEIVENENTKAKTIEVTEVELSDILGIDIIDSQLYAKLKRIKTFMAHLICKG